jgi:hypothetical protein
MDDIGFTNELSVMEEPDVSVRERVLN